MKKILIFIGLLVTLGAYSQVEAIRPTVSAGTLQGYDTTDLMTAYDYDTAGANIWNALSVRCLEAVFGDAIGTGLTLDGTTLKTHLSLQSIAGLTETNGGLLYGTADNAYAWLAAGTATHVLQANGAAAPTWLDIAGSYQGLDATLTALAGLTIGANELLYGTGADAFSMLSVNATATNKFLRQVSSGVPSWEALIAGDIPDISATYQPLNGGLTSLSGLTETNGGIAYGTAANTYAWLGAGAQGTLLMGNGAGAPSWLGAGTSGHMLVAAGAADPAWTAPTGTGSPVKATSPSFTKRIVITADGTYAYGINITGNDQSNNRIQLTNSGAGGESWSIVGGTHGASNAGFAIYNATDSKVSLQIDTDDNIDISNGNLSVSGSVGSNDIEDTDSDNTDVLVTTIADTEYGMLIVRETAGTEACIYLIAGGTIEKISTDATFTVTKDNGSTYNVYFEGNVVKVQNLVGNDKNIRVGLFNL